MSPEPHEMALTTPPERVIRNATTNEGCLLMGSEHRTRATMHDMRCVAFAASLGRTAHTSNVLGPPRTRVSVPILALPGACSPLHAYPYAGSSARDEGRRRGRYGG